ncbi:MAG: glycosyltransferase, partial [Candidatus Aenigmatarchaeota archaeon]
MKPDISIIVPTYNEEKNIARTIYELEKYLSEKHFNGEIVISDDCSTDNTVKVVKGLQAKFGNIKLLTLRRNYYKGWPVKLGMLAAKGKLLLFTDADLRMSQPLYRRLFGKIFTKLMRFLIPDIVDSQCGFKMFNSEVAKRLFKLQRIENIVFDVEILYLARKFGFKISQVPVKWHYSGDSKMRANLKNGIEVLL